MLVEPLQAVHERVLRHPALRRGGVARAAQKRLACVLLEELARVLMHAVLHRAQREAPAVHLCDVAHERVDPLALARVGHARHHRQLARHHTVQLVDRLPSGAHPAPLLPARQPVIPHDLVLEIPKVEQTSNRYRLRGLNERSERFRSAAHESLVRILPPAPAVLELLPHRRERPFRLCELGIRALYLLRVPARHLLALCAERLSLRLHLFHPSLEGLALLLLLLLLWLPLLLLLLLLLERGARHLSSGKRLVGRAAGSRLCPTAVHSLKAEPRQAVNGLVEVESRLLSRATHNHWVHVGKESVQLLEDDGGVRRERGARGAARALRARRELEEGSLLAVERVVVRAAPGGEPALPRNSERRRRWGGRAEFRFHERRCPRSSHQRHHTEP
mmetsp:Transcript_25069/g.82153  ORF Transcript_25069/g.82153 Transcript_25069/m.82153 type:complete len:390 (-) Transcript_25069:21-1190(-)